MCMSTCVTDAILTLLKCLTSQQNVCSNVIGRFAPLLRNNWVQSKAALFAGLQTAYSPQGHYPAQEMRKWAPDVTGKPLPQNAGLNWEWGGEGHARSEFRHVYITAQDISQSRAKLLKFPGSKVAEC